MGAIYSTNITPDPDTGIGSYTSARISIAPCGRGVAKDGHRLYPAMPYPSYAKISDDDVAGALRLLHEGGAAGQSGEQAERNPVAISASAGRWRSGTRCSRTSGSLCRQAAATTPPGIAAPIWSKGLGHCGACHTPRGWAFQEKALDDSSTDLSLGRGARRLVRAESARRPAHRSRRMVAGRHRRVPEERPQPTTARPSARCSTSSTTARLICPTSDIDAMADYLKSLPATPRSRPPSSMTMRPRQALRGGQAATAGRRGLSRHLRRVPRDRRQGLRPRIMPPLAGNPAVLDADPSSLINLVLNGSEAAGGQGHARRLSHAAIPRAVHR